MSLLLKALAARQYARAYWRGHDVLTPAQGVVMMY